MSIVRSAAHLTPEIAAFLGLIGINYDDSAVGYFTNRPLGRDEEHPPSHEIQDHLGDLFEKIKKFVYEQISEEKNSEQISEEKKEQIKFLFSNYHDVNSKQDLRAAIKPGLAQFEEKNGHLGHDPLLRAERAKKYERYLV